MLEYAIWDNINRDDLFVELSQDMEHWGEISYSSDGTLGLTIYPKIDKNRILEYTDLTSILAEAHARYVKMEGPMNHSTNKKLKFMALEFSLCGTANSSPCAKLLADKNVFGEISSEQDKTINFVIYQRGKFEYVFEFETFINTLFQAHDVLLGAV